MLGGPALDVVCENISEEMEECKKQLILTTGDVSITYLKTWSVNGVMESIGLPGTWTRVLEAATTGLRSSNNVSKCPRLVCLSLRTRK